MTTNTAALLRHFANLLHSLEGIYDMDPYVIPKGVADAGDALCVALGLSPDASWDEAADALNAHADSLAPGLPEGWSIDSDGEATNGLICVGPDGVDGIWIDGRWAPASVVRAVLARAQGVGS